MREGRERKKSKEKGKKKRKGQEKRGRDDLDTSRREK